MKEQGESDSSKNSIRAVMDQLSALEKKLAGKSVLPEQAEDNSLPDLLQSLRSGIDTLEKQVEELKELNRNMEDKLDQKTIELFKEQLTLTEVQQLAHIGSWELNIA